MPMRMPLGRAAGVEGAWPLNRLAEGQSQLGARFDLAGASPPGAIERCVGSVGALPGVRWLEGWRHGVLVESNGPAAMALLELLPPSSTVSTADSSGTDSARLVVEVRGAGEPV
eukprot:4575238-Prymnesium_polylepis.1